MAARSNCDEHCLLLDDGQDAGVIERGMQIRWAVAVPRVVWWKVDGYVVGGPEHQLDKGEGIAGVPDDVDGVGERVAAAG